MPSLVVYLIALACLFGQAHWLDEAQTAATVLPEPAPAPQFTPEGVVESQSDPEFVKVHFDDWFSKSNPARVKWTAHISKPQLSVYQRLSLQVEVLVSGAELSRRGWKGHLTAFVQLRDSEGRKYRNHRRLTTTLQDVVRSQDVTCTMSALIVPGDYEVAVAIYDDASREHAVKEERLQVPPLKSDPLPNMWRDLPAIEFVDFLDVPDQWYLPAVTGRLNLTVETRQPVHIELIVNQTPSDWLSGPARVKHSNLGVLVPALKVLSQIAIPNASLDIEVLDLSRRRVIFHQEDVRSIYWPTMRDALIQNGPGTIDLPSLVEGRRHGAAFFISEVANKIGADGPLPVVIILSSPMAFESRGAIHFPLRMPRSSPVFYMRYRTPLIRQHTVVSGYHPDPSRGGRVRTMGGETITGISGPAVDDRQIDQLYDTLKPLHAKLFNVQTPDDFRRALAILLSEISRM